MKKFFSFLIFLCGFILFDFISVRASDYQGNLGYDYSVNSTRFYLFTNRENITNVFINIDTLESIEMIKDDSGIYVIDVGGDLKEKEYYYQICYTDSTCNNTIDPFSSYVNVDGTKNIIVDIAKTSIEEWDDLVTLNNKGEERIYAIDTDKYVENIVSSDATIDSVFEKLIASVDYSGIKVGFDYLLTTGMNYIEVDNFYDKSNYYSPNHMYSSMENNYSAITEVKQLIKKYKNNKMNVVMRVDFTNPSNEMKQSLSILSNDYILDGKLNLNNPMIQRYISEVCKFWINEYKIDGFYFENAGSYNKEYLNNLITEIKAINDKALVYTDDSSFNGYTSDALQETLLGSLNNSNNEGIINGNYSEESFRILLDSMSGGYLTNPTNYKNNKTTIINNFGSFEGLDIYSKLVLLAGLGEKESVTANKLGIALQTIFSSDGIPRIVGGNEFLNVNTIPTSEIPTIPNENKVCNNSNSICYLIGDSKTVEWSYLLKNSSPLSIMSAYRNKYLNYYFNFSSLKDAKNLKINNDYAKVGILLATINYDAKNNGELESINLVINYSGKEVDLGSIKSKEKVDFKGLLVFGNNIVDDDKVKISEYSFYGYLYYQNRKLPNWVYVIVLSVLLLAVFGLRALLIKILKNKQGVDYNEMKKQEKKNRKNKNKDGNVLEKYLGKDITNMFKKNKKSLDTQEQKIKVEQEDSTIEEDIEEKEK